jgi:hypothetical protein
LSRRTRASVSQQPTRYLGLAGVRHRDRKGPADRAGIPIDADDRITEPSGGWFAASTRSPNPRAGQDRQRWWNESAAGPRRVRDPDDRSSCEGQFPSGAHSTRRESRTPTGIVEAVRARRLIPFSHPPQEVVRDLIGESSPSVGCRTTAAARFAMRSASGRRGPITFVSLYALVSMAANIFDIKVPAG